MSTRVQNEIKVETSMIDSSRVSHASQNPSEIGNYLNGNAVQRTDYTSVDTSSSTPLETLCKKNNTTLDTLLSEICGSYAKKADAKEIEIATKCANEAFKDLTNEKENISLAEVKELAKQYYIALNTGWTIKGFKEAQNTKGLKNRVKDLFGYGNDRSFKERLETFCRDKKISYTGDPTQNDTVLKAFFEDFFKSENLRERAIQNLKKANKEVNEETIKAQVEKLQLQTFGRILANCSDKERASIYKALNYMFDNNYVDAATSTIKAGNSPKEQEATAVNVKGVTRTRATNGTLSKETTTKATIVATSHLGKEAAEKSNSEDIQAARKFCEENGINLEELRARYTSNPNGNYTEQEKAALALLGILSGDVIGVANSNVMQANEIHDVLTTFNNEVQEANLATPVYQEVNNYVEQHPECTNLPKEEFTKLMDEVTNNQYSEVVNNTNQEVTPVTETTNNTTDIGYSTKQYEALVKEEAKIIATEITTTTTTNNNERNTEEVQDEETVSTQNNNANRNEARHTEPTLGFYQPYKRTSSSFFIDIPTQTARKAKQNKVATNPVSHNTTQAAQNNKNNLSVKEKIQACFNTYGQVRGFKESIRENGFEETLVYMLENTNNINDVAMYLNLNGNINIIFNILNEVKTSQFTKILGHIRGLAKLQAFAENRHFDDTNKNIALNEYCARLDMQAETV